MIYITENFAPNQQAQSASDVAFASISFPRRFVHFIVKKNSEIIKGVLLILMNCLFAVTSIAQIEGDVVDWKDNGISNAIVIATDAARKSSDTAMSDERGFYEFKGLKPGKYKIEAKAGGFRPVYKNVVVKVGDSGAVEGEPDLYRGTRLDIILRSDAGDNQIEGKVINEKEAGMPNVNITATDSTGKLVASDKSDELGFFSFKGLQAGKYKIQATVSGFQPASYTVKVKKTEKGAAGKEEIDHPTWLYVVLTPAKDGG